MDALKARSGIREAKSDLRVAEVYLLADPGHQLDETELRNEIEGVYGYALRTFERSTELEWDELGRRR
jgi:hypothetical protein